MKKIILVLMMIVMIFVMSFGIFAHSGRTDSNGGHFQKYEVNGVEYVANYHFHDKVTNAIIKTICLKDKHILWKDRDNAIIPTETPIIVTETPTETAIITETPTETPIETSSIPTETAISTSIKPVETKVVTTSKAEELPKTGEESNIPIVISGIILIALGAGGFKFIRSKM